MPTDPVPPMPATWPGLANELPHVVGRLRELWQASTSDDQRYHLERMVDDVLAELADLNRVWL